MGLVLPKPILSKVVDRGGNEFVYSGSASLNGYRTSMEDAHMTIAEAKAEIAYFGIFDGHSNEKCSAYVAQAMPAKLKALSEPITGEKLEKVCVDIDADFISKFDDGGSTGTFCLVRKTGKVTIANVGDSRILIVRNGELIFETVDHKPVDAAERERITRCGGSVMNGRVDGDLAVSRAFGDAMFKVPGKADYKAQKVIAVPDVTDVECKPGDLIILCCDGVFESNFSNAEVARFVTDQQSKCWNDLAVVAARVTDEAVRRGSKDNISCMVVQLGEGASKVAQFGPHSFVPGPPFPRSSDPCRKSFSRMAELANMTCADALQQRYKLLQAYDERKLATLMPPVLRTAFEMSDEVDLDAERAFFGSGPAPGGEKAFFNALAASGSM